MSFFSKLMRKNVFLGVDIGTSSIKAVEVMYDNQKTYLTNYGSITLREAGMDAFSAPSLSKAISALLGEMQVKANRVYVSLPSSNGLVALLEFPVMTGKELEQAIQFEAHKYIPADIEDVALSWEIVHRSEERSSLGISLKKENKENKKEPLEVLLVAALKNDVALLSSHFSKAQYEIHAIELESFSLARSLTTNESKDVLIVDIGHSICNFALVSKGVVRMSRNIDVGGKGITDTIADSMNVSPAKADSLKKGKENLFNKKEMSITFASLDVVVGEANRMIASYEKKHGEKKVQKIILSGGTSGMVGLEDFFTEKMGRTVERGNSWKNIEYEEMLNPFIQEMGNSFSVSIGLALRGVDDFRRGV
jgi:type IV pilus assembly protein PilM